MTQRNASTTQMNENELLSDSDEISEAVPHEQRMVSGFESLKKKPAAEIDFSDNTGSGPRLIPRLVHSATKKERDTASEFAALLEFPAETDQVSSHANSAPTAAASGAGRVLWVTVVLLGSAVLGAFLGFIYRDAQRQVPSSEVNQVVMPTMTVSQPAVGTPQAPSAPATVQFDVSQGMVQPEVAEPQPVAEPSVEAAEQEAAAGTNASAPAAQARRWRPLTEKELAARAAAPIAEAAPVEEVAAEPVVAQEVEVEVQATQPAAAEVTTPEVVEVKLPETLSREVVKAGFEALRPALTACANGKAGVADVAATIATNGRVTHAVVNGDFVGTAGSCMARAIRSARFEPFANGPLMVEFPYQL